MDRDVAIKRIRKALKKKTGKSWSVTGGRGTGWGWIDVQAPPRRRINHAPNPAYINDHETPDMPRHIVVQPPPNTKGWYTSDTERKQLTRAFGLTHIVHYQGLMISPDKREFYVSRVENGVN